MARTSFEMTSSFKTLESVADRWFSRGSHLTALRFALAKSQCRLSGFSRELRGPVSQSCLSPQMLYKNFGFINGVDNVNWPPYRDSKS